MHLRMRRAAWAWPSHRECPCCHHMMQSVRRGNWQCGVTRGESGPCMEPPYLFWNWTPHAIPGLTSALFPVQTLCQYGMQAIGVINVSTLGSVAQVLATVHSTTEKDELAAHFYVQHLAFWESHMLDDAGLLAKNGKQMVSVPATSSFDSSLGFQVSGANATPVRGKPSWT